MTRPSPQIETEMSFRLSARYHKFRIEPSSVKKYLAYRGIAAVAQRRPVSEQGDIGED
ncbi:MAG: hypothetical protein J0H40_07620 [Rhizobiales bacterium]|nr:hypothetical protein [Hyphomicrobiales bacterium]